MAEINFNQLLGQMDPMVRQNYEGVMGGQSFSDQYNPDKRTVNADGTITDTNSQNLTMKDGYSQMVDAYNQEQNIPETGLLSSIGSALNPFSELSASEMPQTYGLQNIINNTQPQNLGFRSMVDMNNDVQNFDSQFSYPNRGPVATNIATAPQPKGMSYEQMVDLGLAGPDQDVGMTAEDLQNRPSFFGDIKGKIGSGFNNFIDNPVTRGLGTAINFARGSVPGMLMSGIGALFNRDPNAPSYQSRTPGFDYNNLNESMINDFYDSNPESDGFGTNRFDRAVPGSFASFRTLSGYLNRNKNAAAALTTKKAKKEAAMQQQIKEAEARQAELNRRQSIVDAQTARGFTTSGGSGNYSSSKDHSRAGGYGGTGRASNEARSNDLGFSDIRLKDNIELVGKSPSNINIYNFTYLNDPKVYQGVMAQEVPWASVEHNSGYLMVDYSKVDVEFKRKDAFASMFTRRR